MVKRILFLLVFLQNGLQAQNLVSFGSPDQAFAYAEQNSVVMKTGDAQRLLARWTEITALANTLNPRAPLSVSMTNNTELPVTFIPAEIFGGPAGVYQPVRMGQQYVNTVAVTPQIDLVNLSSWQRVKSAQLNSELTELNNVLSKKALLESVSAAYYNILSLQEQIRVAEIMLKNSDSIVTIVSNKLNEGIVREQDLNNARINRLNLEDRLAQLRLSLAQNINSLKILCDIPAADSVVVTGTIYSGGEEPLTTDRFSSGLTLKRSELNYRYLRSEMRASRLASWTPVVSFVFNQGWQNNSNVKWWDTNAEWYKTQYIGFRLSFPIIPEMSKVSQNRVAYTNMRIGLMNYEHAQIENALSNRSQDLEYSKSCSAYATSREVYRLRQSNYEKSLSQFRENILPPQQMFDSFNELLNSHLNYIAATANAWHQRNKITISKLAL